MVGAKLRAPSSRVPAKRMPKRKSLKRILEKVFGPPVWSTRSRGSSDTYKKKQDRDGDNTRKGDGAFGRTSTKGDRRSGGVIPKGGAGVRVVEQDHQSNRISTPMLDVQDVRPLQEAARLEEERQSSKRAVVPAVPLEHSQVGREAGGLGDSAQRDCDTGVPALDSEEGIGRDFVKKPGESFCTAFQRHQRRLLGAAYSKESVLQVWRDMTAEQKDLWKQEVCGSRKLVKGEDALQNVEGDVEHAVVEPVRLKYHFGCRGEVWEVCTHPGCQEEAWMVCCQCGVPLCGEHGGIFLNGTRESLCHEHALTEETDSQEDADDFGSQVLDDEVVECKPEAAEVHHWLDVAKVVENMLEEDVDKMCVNIMPHWDGDSLKQIRRDHGKRRQKCEWNVTEDFAMYLRLARLRQRGLVESLREMEQMACRLKITRKKLAEASQALEAATNLTEIPVPDVMMRGRYGVGRVSRDQALDIAEHIRKSGNSNCPMTHAQILELISSYRIFNSGASAVMASRLSKEPELKQMLTNPGTYKAFVRRVNAILPWKQQLTRKGHLKGMSSQEAASCTPAGILSQMRSIQDMLASMGILDGENRILPSMAGRIWWVDEKGVDARKQNAIQCVVAKESTRNLSTAVPTQTFKHVSICQFFSLEGWGTEPTVITSGKSLHKDMGSIWPGAQIVCQDRGSMTGELFVEALEHWWQQLPKALKESKQEVFLGMDSGGGTAPMHVTTEKFSQWCNWRRVRPYMLDKNTTKALCPLDQQFFGWVNAEWQKFKMLHPEVRLHTRAVLYVLADIFKRAKADSQLIKTSWRSIGMKEGFALDMEYVTVHRAKDLFRCHAHAQLKGNEEPRCKESLELCEMKNALKRRVKCSLEGCGHIMTAAEKYCSKCGQESGGYDELAAKALQGGRSGWRQPCFTETQVPVDHELAACHRDLMSTLMKRKRGLVGQSAFAEVDSVEDGIAAIQEPAQHSADVGASEDSSDDDAFDVENKEDMKRFILSTAARDAVITKVFGCDAKAKHRDRIMMIFHQKVEATRKGKKMSYGDAVRECLPDIKAKAGGREHREWLRQLLGWGDVRNIFLKKDPKVTRTIGAKVEVKKEKLKVGGN